MPGPTPPQIELSEREPSELEGLVRVQKTPQTLDRRARVLLLTAMGYTNVEIARLVPMEEERSDYGAARWEGLSAVPTQTMSVAKQLGRLAVPGAVPVASL